TVYPPARENRPPTGETRPTTIARTPPQNKVALVNLATGEKVEFENMRRFAFSGEAGNWIALQKAPASRAPASTPPADGTSPSFPATSASSAPTGADLLLHELATGAELNLGNVSEFAFDKKGQWLALVIDAQGQAGNGVQLRNMTTGVLLPLDTAKATYRHL